MKQLSNSQWSSLILLFTAGEEQLRPVLTKPFMQDGYICATDTYLIIRVAERLIPEGSFKCDALDCPSVDKVMPAHNPKFSVSLSELKNAFVASGIDYSTIMIDCPHCNVECEVEWKFTDNDGDVHSKWDDCPCCDGTGFVRNAYNRFCKLGEVIINAHRLLLLYRAMNDLFIEKALVSFDHRRQLRFYLAEGVDIIIMPTSKLPDTYKTPVEIKTEKI